jgi:hypothetical protein
LVRELEIFIRKLKVEKSKRIVAALAAIQRRRGLISVYYVVGC